MSKGAVIHRPHVLLNITKASETDARCCRRRGWCLCVSVPPQATLLAEKHGLKVCIIDPNLEKRWIPNYGVWVEEWEALDKDLQVPGFVWGPFSPPEHVNTYAPPAHLSVDAMAPSN